MARERTLQIKVSDRQLERINGFAKVIGMSRDAIIRGVIEKYLLAEDVIAEEILANTFNEHHRYLQELNND